MNRPTECTESLRCPFTDEEKLRLGKELADAHIQLSELDDEEAVIKAQMKQKRATAEGLIGRLSREVSAGFTMRDVKMRIVYDDPNPNEVSYYREDSLDLVRTRPFTKEERQADLPLLDGKVVPAEDSQANIAEFFEKPAIEERTDDEPEVIEDADPLGITEPQTVGRARENLLKM